VTALGVASPIGIGPEDFWASLLSGADAAGPVRAFDASAFGVDIGCELDPDTALAGSAQTGRAARLAATAGAQALGHAGLSASQRAATALCVGTTMGEACWLESWGAELLDAPEDRLPADELLRSGPDQIGSDVAELLGLHGGRTVVGGACAAGNYAISRAMDLVRLGRAERVLAGGTDSFSRVAYTGFASLGALARNACRPFSADREGLVLGEGAAMLLIESVDAARARGAAPLARLAGAGLSCDAHHIVSPHPEGDGVVRALRGALAEASAGSGDVDWVCAHGTGTRANDAREVRAAGSVFGSDRPPMSSIKALTGHCLGASSAFEAVACVLALQRQVIPPTWNFGATDPDCDWDVVPSAPRQASLTTVVNNASAFGGANAAVVLRRAD